MDYYKKLNKELITEVQIMKGHIAFLRKEANELRNQMMDEHLMRVEQEQHFLKLLTQNYRDMVSSVRPGANFLNLISNEFDCYENADISSNKRLSSRNILGNLRHSIKVHATRSSLVSMSPVPRRKSIESIEFNKSPLSPEPEQTENSMSDLEESSIVDVDDDKDYEEQQQQPPPQQQQQQQLNVMEEVYSEDEENKENHIAELDKEDEAVITADVKRLSLLESICEEVSEEFEESCATDVVEHNSIHLNDIKEINEPKQPKRKSKYMLRDLTNCEEFTVRSTLPDLGDSFGLPLPTLNSHIVCSTPRSTEIFTDECSELKTTKSVDRTEQSYLKIERPRRSCRPSNLQEQSCRLKLRNETASKTVSKKNSKSTSKRKTSNSEKQKTK